MTAQVSLNNGISFKSVSELTTDELSLVEQLSGTFCRESAEEAHGLCDGTVADYVRLYVESHHRRHGAWPVIG